MCVCVCVCVFNAVSECFMYVCVFTFSQSASAGKAKTMPFGASAGEPIHTTSLQTKQVDSESTSIAFGVVFLTGVGFGAGVGVGLGVTDGVGLGVADGVGVGVGVGERTSLWSEKQLFPDVVRSRLFVSVIDLASEIQSNGISGPENSFRFGFFPTQF